MPFKTQHKHQMPMKTHARHTSYQMTSTTPTRLKDSQKTQHNATDTATTSLHAFAHVTQLKKANPLPTLMTATNSTYAWRACAAYMMLQRPPTKTS
jgi:hypothetical protein